jgi:hypothetical protein
MAPIKDEYKSGDAVPHSGIYKVAHDKHHAAEHEVTCVFGKVFPPCRICGLHPRFTLIKSAHHIDTHVLF